MGKIPHHTARKLLDIFRHQKYPEAGIEQTRFCSSPACKESIIIAIAISNAMHMPV